MENRIVTNDKGYGTSTLTYNMLQKSMGFSIIASSDSPFNTNRKQYICDSKGNITETTFTTSTGIVLQPYETIVRIGKYNFLIIQPDANKNVVRVDKAFRDLLKYLITQYDNTNSGLTAKTLSGAIDELAARPVGVDEATVDQKIQDAITTITDFTEVSF